jgi:copper transport protein
VQKSVDQRIVLMITNPHLRDDRSATVKHIGRRPDPSRASRPTVPQGRRRTPWALGIILAAVLGWLPCTEAHALLERSTPPNGAALARAPDDVFLVFTEQPEPALSSVQVLDASGRPVAGGAPQPVRGQPLELRLPLPSLPAGAYTVTWRTVSRIDGHVAAGAVSFGVGGAPSPAQPPHALNPPPSALYVLSRVVLYLGLSSLLAIAVAGASAPPLALSLRPSLLPAWTIATLGLVLLGVAQARDTGTGLSRLLGTPLGHELWWRALPIATATVAVRGVFGEGRARWKVWVALAVLAALAMLAHVAAGHAGGDAGPRRLWNILNQWAHFAGIGVWAGGLLAVWLTGPPRRAHVDATTPARLSVLAAGALVVAGVTGALRVAGEVTAWSILVSTAFGILVLVKAASLVVLGLLGAVARHLTFRSARGRASLLDLVIAAEMAVAIGAFAATAYLTGLPVPKATQASAASAIVVTGADYATSVRLRLRVTPGLLGTNQFAAEIADYDSQRPVARAHVTLRFMMVDRPDIGPSNLALSEGPAGVYRAEGGNLSLYGRWSVVATVEIAARAVEVRLQLTIPPARQAVRIISTPGKPPVYLIDLSGGRILSIYLDPGKTGFNAIHGTFVDARGQELVLTCPPELTVAHVGERTRSLATLREGPGHFSAGGDFGPGEWRFQILATTRTGEFLRAQLAVRL